VLAQPGSGELPRYDEIGYAPVRPVSGGGTPARGQERAAPLRLPANSYVEAELRSIPPARS
jgi:rare lipoprotein A